MGSEFCCECSALAGEPIVATAAADTWLWLALEHRPAWAAKAYESADLPAPVRATIDGWLANLQGSRVQLIRRPRRDVGPLAFYVACTRPGHAIALRFDLADVNDLLTIDVPAIARALEHGTPLGAGQPCERPVVLVCTHGKRDRCCAKWGIPLYERMATQSGIDAWHTSHLGGHRFAPTLLVLPTGLCYGRLTLDEVEDLALAVRSGRIHRLDRLRGRTAHSLGAMATEHFVRAHTGRLEDEAVTIASVRMQDDGDLESEARANGQRFHLRLAWTALTGSAPPSCGKAPEPIEGVVLRAFAEHDD